MRRVCLVPRLQGVGGMVSFEAKLAAGLARRGIQTNFDLNDTPYDAVLVIGGTRDLPGLWRARQRGGRVVQRLDGMNWIHRKRKTGLRHYLRAEYGNLLLSLIRRRLAQHIVYQSRFSKTWWERVYGPTRTGWSVVLNGVDLQQYSPIGPEKPPADSFRLLLVEGSLGGGYELGLETAVALAMQLKSAHQLSVELMAVGRVADSVQAEWKQRSSVPLTFTGQVPRESIPGLDRSAHLLYAADLNAACPNSVIEALACGLPVVALDTGALSELVSGDAGRLSPYGGDPWKLEPPDITGLAIAAARVLADQPRFRSGARQRAETALDLDTMVTGYLEALG